MTLDDDLLKGRGGKVLLLVLVTGIVAFFHFFIPTDQHTLHMIHIALRKLYFLPLVMAAAWFGLRGGVFATLVVSGFFSLHAFLDWPGNDWEQANQAGELVSFWVVGLSAGWLFEREQSLLKDLARANEETLLALVSALDLRERETRLHSQRVREYAGLLAARFGLDEKQKQELGFGALLHDVGKIAVPDRVLLKTEALTEEEWRIMHEHPVSGYRVVQQIGFLREAGEVVYAHHEHFDGSGYPRRLAGEEICLGARLFAVADVYDALTSERPYHNPLSHEEAVSKIVEKSGTHFDPQVVRAFLTINSEELKAIRERYQEAAGSPERVLGGGGK